MNFSAHPVAVRAGFVTSDVSVALAGAAATGGDGSCGPFESAGGVVAAGDVVADAGGAAAWARRSTSFPAADAAHRSSAAVWQNTMSPIEAVIVQQVFLIASS